jgi:hypothetical protein
MKVYIVTEPESLRRIPAYVVIGRTAAQASIGDPLGRALDAERNLYISSHLGAALLRVSPSGSITLLVRRLQDLDEVFGVDIDSSGTLYVADRISFPARQIRRAMRGSPTFAHNGRYAVPHQHRGHRSAEEEAKVRACRLHRGASASNIALPAKSRHEASTGSRLRSGDRRLNPWNVQ